MTSTDPRLSGHPQQPTHPHERLAAGAHDRASLRRSDDAWLERRWSDPSTRVLVVAGTKVRPEAGNLPWVAPDRAPAGVRLLLGDRDGRTHFAVVTGPERADDDGWVTLRGLLPHLAGGAAEPDSALVLHALGMAEWHWATRFCPRCGGTLEPRAAGHELACTACGRRQFPRTDPAVIMLVTHGEPGADDERCLLGRQRTWPEGRFSTLAGFCEPGEALEDAVRREVAEETGVPVGEVSYVGNQPWPLPASLMLGFRGRALDTRIERHDGELADARWVTRGEMRAQAEEGTLLLPSGVSISRTLIEGWAGGPVPGHW